MCELTKEEVSIKLITILNKLSFGRYELEYDTKKNRFELVIYNTADYGVFSAIYVPKHRHLEGAFTRLQEIVDTINKYG